LRDFHNSDWAVEVKTTSTNNPQKIIVNGERQLDETSLRNLFLVHFSYEISKGNGQTLCQMVSMIRSILENEAPALSLFNTKLFEAGYLDIHEPFSKGRFYRMRNESFYKIEKEFPRIREYELRNGVSDVKYSIILAMCDEYLVSENQMLSVINVL
jgi:hypothetical protein